MTSHPKSGTETRDFWWDPRPGTHLVGATRDPKRGTRDSRLGTQFIGGTWNPGSGTLKVSPETRDTRHLFYMGPKTREPGH